MSTIGLSARVLRRAAGLLIAVLSVALVSAGWPGVRQARADEPGTIGIVARQLFSGRVANHRGPLAVLHVFQDSPAAKAGIHCSDFILAVNGVPVAGREYAEIQKKELDGPVGGTVRLTVARFDGTQSEIALVRAAFPPHVNEGSDPFVYAVPGVWDNDPRTAFPLSWAPTLAYHGFADLYFSPNFDQTDSPEYHSYAFFMSLEGTHLLTAEQLEADMLAWYRGLAVERGGANQFTPDLSKVSVKFQEERAPSGRWGGEAVRAFGGTAGFYDTHGKIITLNTEVLMIAGCGPRKDTVFYFGLTLEPRDGEMWKQLDAIRDTFHCKP